MATTQNELIPHQHRTAVGSWFRIPLKLIACIGLVSLHSDDNEHGRKTVKLGYLLRSARLESFVILIGTNNGRCQASMWPKYDIKSYLI